jgi:hypothetical protein
LHSARHLKRYQRIVPLPARRCAFIKLYGLVGSLIAAGLLLVSLLALAASAWQVWSSQNPAWPAFKASAAAVLSSLMLMGVVLGQEFGWWRIDGEILDSLGVAWVAVTVIAAGLTYWLVR